MDIPIKNLCSSTIQRFIVSAETSVIEACKGSINDSQLDLFFQRAFRKEFSSAVEQIFEEIKADVPIEKRQPFESFWGHVGSISGDRILSAAKIVTSAIRNKSTFPDRIDAMGSSLAIELKHNVETTVQDYINRDKIINPKLNFKDRSVPEVAVMMWFPDEATHAEEFKLAKKRYQIFRDLVFQITGGKWRTNKFNDPEILPKDRISSDVEKWIQNAKLVIVDLTGERPDVFYELGFAKGCKTQTITICPKPILSSLSAHIRSIPHVVYQTEEELSVQLKAKLVTAFHSCD